MEDMKKVKLMAALILAAVTFQSCSLIGDLKEKLGGGKEENKEVKEQTVPEDTYGRPTQNDLQFYNKYIDVLNKISEAAERFHKSYLSDVPDPKSVTKQSLIFVIASDVYLGQVEQLLKNYQRSLFDKGELANLKPDNDTMKREIEASFKNLLGALDSYQNQAREVVNYYKNKGYQKDVSLAEGYDERLNNEYDNYKEAFDNFNNTVRKFKPQRTRRDPDKISDPGGRSVAILMNAYENTVDAADSFYNKFQDIENDSSTAELSKLLDDFEAGFKEETKKVESTDFTDRTKFMKYNFEDYFTKTVNDFVTETRKFLDRVNTKKLSMKNFNTGYDDVMNYYNYMINAYNSSIGTLNTYSNY
jgi:hypothetical protein